jgi:hypothetical protein
MLTMGNDLGRRQRFGKSFGKASNKLGGIYPWVSEMLADVPILAGSNIAAGLRELQRDPFGPFATTVPIANGLSVSANGVEALIDVDLDLLHTLLNFVKPLTGNLNSHTSGALLEVLRTELRRESSLAEEARQRELLGRLDETIATVALTPDGEGRWTESLPLHLEVGPSAIVLGKAIRSWSTLILRDGVIPARLTWSNCAIDDEDRLVLLGRLAGTATVRRQVQGVVADLILALPPNIPESLFELLGENLRVGRESISGLASSIMSLVDPEGWPAALGPLGSLRAVDTAAGQTAEPLQIGLDALLLVRQLALFRSMADDLGKAGSYFTVDVSNGE